MKLIYETPEGGVAVVAAAPGVPIANLVSKVVPYGASWDMVDENSLPSDRTFRNAWIKVGSNVVEDLTKSKLIAASRLRDVAINSISIYNTRNDLGEATAFNKAAIANAYEECLTDITGYTTVSEVKACLSMFKTTYEN